MAEHDHAPGFHGPKCWAASAAAGTALGLAAGILAPRFLPAPAAAGHPDVPLWLVAPFAALLLSIAVMPFLAPRFWHRHYPDVSLFLGGAVAAYVATAYSAPGPGGHAFGPHAVLHAALEYYAFIALVGGLFIASGGISVRIRGRGTPALNTTLLAAGALLANLVGTTGASVLLIRPFMRANAGRLTPTHIVFFILAVSNCGGSLTPIGDPPLYLGYLKGVPFFWTLRALWPDWLLVVGGILAVFFAYDLRVGPVGAHAAVPGVHPGPTPPATERPGVSIRGMVGIVGLLLLVAGVFIDPALKGTSLEGLPIGATFQGLVALATYLATDPASRRDNGFTWEPIKEVGLLFAGIFLTMVPALAYLAAHGPSLGLSSPTAFYAGTGALSAVLDNAPTYLNFLQIGVGRDLDAAAVRGLLEDPAGVGILHAVSTAAVYFGALTYIGNGPNFMVKAIAESSGVRMPSFFGYLARALAVLGPVLLVHWAVFIRG